MNIIINGTVTSCEEHSSIIDLLSQLQVNPETVIVEKNKEIIPSTTFSTTILNEQDVLELLHFVGGG